MLATWPHIVRQFAHALNPAGGLSYHYLAYKYQKSLWRSHSAELQQRLITWKPWGQDLILFGPSGGYSLPSDFLARFRHIFIYDPDPLAEIIFKKRFAGRPVTWFQRSLIFDSRSRPQDDLRFLRSHHPEAAILFANSLGQWPLLNPSVSEELIASFVQNLDSEFSQIGWASYHDIFSGKVKKSTSQPEMALRLRSREDVEKFWFKQEGVDVVDHLTFDAFQNASKQHWLWTLTPQQMQIIEWAQGPLQKTSTLNLNKKEPYENGDI